eukprot:5600349-Pleurochrysis_carterae.AAC.1
MCFGVGIQIAAVLVYDCPEEVMEVRLGRPRSNVSNCDFPLRMLVRREARLHLVSAAGPNAAAANTPRFSSPPSSTAASVTKAAVGSETAVHTP